MKKLIFLFLMLIGWLSGSGQDRGHQFNLGSRSLFIEEKHFMGFNTNNYIPMDVEASTLKEKFSQNVSIISVIDYPLGLFYDDNKNYENYFSGTEAKIKNEYSGNYILFVTLRSDKDNEYKVRVFSSINSLSFPSLCQNKTSEFAALINAYFNNQKAFLNGDQIFTAILNTLKEANRILDAGCELTETDEEALYLSKGYKIFDIIGNDIVDRLNGVISRNNSLRSSCPIVIDSSRVVIDPGGKTLAEYFFGGSDYLAFSAQYVLTSGFTPLPTRVLLESQITSDTTCDLSVHVHIPNNVYGTPLEKIFLKLRVQNQLPSGWYETTKNNLRQKFDLGIYDNGSLTNWIFQFKNHKALITTYLINDPKYVPNQNAAYVGLICGFADSFINDIQFLANIAILNNKFRAGSHEALQVYFFQAALLGLSGAQAEEDFKTYIQEIINTSDVVDFGNNFFDIGQALTMFRILIKDSLADQWEKMQFRESSFDVGYAAGESVYVALGLKALIVGAGKGILAVSKGAKKSMLTTSGSVKSSLTKENVYEALRNTKIIFNWDKVKDIYKAFGVNLKNFKQLDKKKWAYSFDNDTPLPKEIEFTDEIGEHLQENIVLAPEYTKGFDAISEEGKVLSYKVMDGPSVSSNLTQLKDNLSQAISSYRKLPQHKDFKVDIWVKGDYLSKEDALANWNIIKDTNVLYTDNLDIIGKIYYKGPNGIIEFN